MDFGFVDLTVFLNNITYDACRLYPLDLALSLPAFVFCLVV